MGTPRSGFAAAPVRGKVVVFGGEELGPGGSTIEQVELFDPESNRWSELPDMLTPRHGLGGVSRKRRVFALEGGPRPGFAFSSAVEFIDIPKTLTP
jgi:non-specific serine/threonine protein kinase